MKAVEELSRKCEKIENELAGRPKEAITVTLDGRNSDHARFGDSTEALPARQLLITHASPSQIDQGMNLSEIKNALDLLKQISQLATAPTTEDAIPSWVQWDKASVGTPDTREEYHGENAKQKQNRAVKYQETDSQRPRKKEVVVDADAKVVRALNPRPCHKLVSLIAKLGIWLTSRAVRLAFTSVSRFTPVGCRKTANPSI